MLLVTLKEFMSTPSCLYDDEVTYLASDLQTIPASEESEISQDDCFNPKPSFNVTDALSALSTNKLKFDDLQDYDFTLTRSCFCPPNTRQGPFQCPSEWAISR